MKAPQTPATFSQAKKAFQNPTDLKPAMRAPFRTVRAALLILLIVAASAVAALPGSSAASASESPRASAPMLPAPAAEVPHLIPRAPAPLALFFSGSETISTFNDTCGTASSSFDLGATICVVATGPVSASRVLRRVRLVNPDNLIVDSVDLTTASQTFSFTLPSAATGTLFGFPVDNRGTWRIDIVDTSDGSVREFSFVTVHDPARQIADLQVNSTVIGDLQTTAGSNITIQVKVFNAGPDAAANVSFSDISPANTTFQSISQTSGPTFNCTTPGVNAPGTTTCTRASLANGDGANFLVSYKVNATIANGTDLTSSASVSSNTTDNRGDSDTAESGGTASNPSPPPCTLTCPVNITQSASAGQNGSIVTFDPPATAGTCGSVTSTPASGSFFHIGTSVVTSTTSNGFSCSFSVTVTDDEDPSISCPANMTVDENPAGGGSANVSYNPDGGPERSFLSVICQSN